MSQVEQVPVEQVSSAIQLQGTDLAFARIAQGATVDGATTFPSGFKPPEGKWVIHQDTLRRRIDDGHYAGQYT